ncbi:MAG: SAM-dependent methyltransferase [Moraxellaceae bacterium]|nr:SAM-dependent methyltransferase [Moraxellaceae bacterium]
MQQFLQTLQQSTQQNTLLKLVLSKYQGQEIDLQRVTIRPIILRDEASLSFVYTYKTKDITKNFNLLESVTLIEQLLNDFKNANLFTQQQELQLSISKKNKASLLVKQVSGLIDAASTVEHDRQKQRLLSLENDFWFDLGVVDAEKRLIPAMSRKWKQINKFIEIFARAVDEAKLDLSQDPIHVVDFGSGKGYLTFAIHEYLRQQYQHQAQVTGVELRDNLVQLCNTAIERFGVNRLNFYQGDVRSYHPQKTDVMIALHACDIATDYAIHTGIRLGAKIIMCAPCCHKQIRPQMQSPQVLKPVLQHGVHLGQEAEMITDGLRALLLEANGYQTQVFEFVSLEHTSKNKMILAIKKQVSLQQKQEVLEQVAAIKRFYSIKEHCLESLLAG